MQADVFALKTLAGATVRDGTRYSFEGLTVVPINTDPNILGFIYLSLRKDRRLSYLFHESVPDLDVFLSKFKNIPVLGCFGVDQNVCGIGYAHPIQEVPLEDSGRCLRKSEVGMAFMHGARRTVDFGFLMLLWAFEQLELDVVYGCTPVLNSAAVAYRERLGFDLIGRAPCYTAFEGKMCDAILSAITYSSFKDRINAEPPILEGGE